MGNDLSDPFESRGYAAFLQNADFFFGVYSQGLHPGLVYDAPSGHGIGNVLVLKIVMCVIGLDLTHALGSPL